MKFTFKPFKGDQKSPDEDSSDHPRAKRKEQIRRAQKTHRERKEAYTKSLENQVVQLRANEAMILQESKWLYSEVTALRQIVAAHGMELPSSIVPSQPGVAVDFRSHGDAFDLSIRFTDSKHKQRQIHVERLSTHIHQEHYGQQMMTRGNISSLSDGSQTISSFNRPFLSPTDSQQSSNQGLVQTPSKCIAELDPTTVGMDFVLSLESPCLDHITSADPEVSNGHALMVSATILHHNHSPISDGHHHHTHNHWQMPASGIERLLKLAESMPKKDHELTPVQAWDLLRKHPEFGMLEVERLGVLKSTLVQGIKCYGYGGVIDQGAFDNALFETFVVGRVF